VHSRLRRLSVQAHINVRIAAQRRAHLGSKAKGRQAASERNSGRRARLLPRAAVSEFRQPGARDVASRNAKAICDEGRGVGETGLGVYLDLSDAIARLGVETIRERYGNLFDMYQRITDEDPYKVPMRIYPAIHYTMGGLWVDYQLQSNVPGLFVLGEANFSDHGANRLGASALMQGLSDGYFIIPYTVGNYLASTKLSKVTASHPEAQAALASTQQGVAKLLAIRGKRTVDSFHRELGKIMWDDCGMSRNAAAERGHRQDSRITRGVLAEPECDGLGRRSESEPRESWARGGFSRTGRAAVHRCAGAQ